MVTYDSVRLFAERATAVWPGFSLTEDVAPAVGEICRRLDGLPLAIELAAARVGMLSVSEIAGRLSDPLPLLRTTDGGRPRRHQSLTAALEWGHELLSAAEAVVFARLSVFVGGFSLAAAEAVCAPDRPAPEGDPHAETVFDLLASLVARSLVVTDHGEPCSRYTLLETVRAFALGKLVAGGEEAQARALHAEWFVGVAERADSGFGPETREDDFAPLIDDDANLRAAL